MIFYAVSCKTASFNDSSIVSVGESFITGKDYGGPVYIGYTRSIDNLSIERILNKFTIRLNKGQFKLGIADAFSLSDAQSFSFEESLAHEYLGDPEIELWTNEPQRFSNIAVTHSNSSITITGIAEDSIIVAYCSNKGVIQKKIASPSSVIISTLDHSGTIMVYKHNYLPYISPLFLQKVELNNSQYVIATDVTAGNLVDNNRTPGDVIVKNGVEYEIEASGTVTLNGGFIVEKGATFAVYPASY